MAVSTHLGLPPVATYAGVCLWNYKPLFTDESVDRLENLSTLHTFTGSLDESWFYLVSVAIEARGAPIIPAMLTAIAAARVDDGQTVTECLQFFAERLDGLIALLQRMYENCDTHVFYHRVRPFLAGSKNMADAGLPNGLIYDDGGGPDVYRQYSGGSNAQSSLIQFFDIVLGIEHRPTGERRVECSDVDEGSAPPPQHNFINVSVAFPPPNKFFLYPTAPWVSMFWEAICWPYLPRGFDLLTRGGRTDLIQDMRTYMPGPHRRFLEHVSSVANIREYVERRRHHDRPLRVAFDACLTMLQTFRDEHIRMVSRYIIIPSRASRKHARSLSPRAAPPHADHHPSPTTTIASRSTDTANSTGRPGKLRGTGGTALIPFLKQARDETGEPAINAWTRKLLGHGPTKSGQTVMAAESAIEAKVEIVGLAGTWTMDDSEGGLCHW